MDWSGERGGDGEGIGYAEIGKAASSYGNPCEEGMKWSMEKV